MTGRHFEPVNGRIFAFRDEMVKFYNEACNTARTEIREQEKQEVFERVYANASIEMFARMTVSEDNYKLFNSVFKLMDAFEKIKPTDREAILKMGLEKGFSGEESLCIYSLAKFAPVLDNMRSHKEDMVEFILAEA